MNLTSRIAVRPVATIAFSLLIRCTLIVAQQASADARRLNGATKSNMWRVTQGDKRGFDRSHLVSDREHGITQRGRLGVYGPGVGDEWLEW